MSTKQSNIKTNWIFYAVNSLLGYITPLLVTPYVSRIFGADGIGINGYTTANVTYFTIFCMLGVAGYGQREVAICRDDREKASKLFWELFILHMITSAIALAFYIVLIWHSGKDRIYYIVNLITVFASVINFNWFLEAYEKFKFIAVRNCIVKLCGLMATFIFIRTKEDLPIYIGINALLLFLSNFSVIFGIRKYINRISIKELDWKQHIKEVLVYFVPTIAASVYSVLDKSVINWVTRLDSENGYYEQAYNIYQLINALTFSLEAVTAPRMSNIFANGTSQEFKKRFNDSLYIMIFTAMPCVVGVAAVAPTLVPVFLGEGYSQVIPILYVFMILVLVVGGSVYLDGLYIVPSGQRGKSACAVCVGSILNFFLNIVLVIKWKAFGAAIATLVTEIVITSIMTYISWKHIDKRRTVAALARYGVTGGIMFFCVRGLFGTGDKNVQNLLLQIITGGVIYISLLLLQRDKFTMEAMGRIIGIWKRRKKSV